MKPFEFVKEHPVTTGALVIVGGIALFMILSAMQNSGGGATTSSASTIDPNLLAYNEQQNQLTAQLNSQTSQQQYGLALDAQDQAAALQAATIGANTQVTLANTAAGVTNNANQWNYQAAIAGISAQLAGLVNTNQTTQNVAQISANENEAINASNNNVAIVQSNNLTTLGVTQVKAWQDVENTISTNNMISGIVGSTMSMVGSMF